MVLLFHPVVAVYFSQSSFFSGGGRGLKLPNEKPQKKKKEVVHLYYRTSTRPLPLSSRALHPRGKHNATCIFMKTYFKMCQLRLSSVDLRVDVHLLQACVIAPAARFVLQMLLLFFDDVSRTWCTPRR